MVWDRAGNDGMGRMAWDMWDLTHNLCAMYAHYVPSRTRNHSVNKGLDS